MNNENKQKITKDIFSERIRDVIIKALFNNDNRGLGFIIKPFYMMDIEETDDIDTIAVDIKDMKLVYNSDFISNYIDNNNIMLGLLIHEMMHVLVFSEQALFNTDKIPIKFNHIISNISQDIVINHILKNKMRLKLPTIGLIPNNSSNGSIEIKITDVNKIFIKDIENKSWIEIYNEIINELDKLEKSGCKITGDFNNIVNINNNGKETINDEGVIIYSRNSNNIEQGNNIDDVLKNASLIINKMKETIKDIKDIGNNKGIDITFIDIINEMINKRNKYDKLLFNKLINIVNANRMKKSTNINKKEYIKSRNISYNKELKGIKCYTVVDVSGSMNESVIVKSINIIYDIMKHIGGTIYICSYDVEKVYEKEIKRRIKSKQDLNIKVSKGGTNIKNMLNLLYSIKNKRSVKILITDMLDDVDEKEYEKLDILITNNNNTKLKNAIIIDK